MLTRLTLIMTLVASFSLFAPSTRPAVAQLMPSGNITGTVTAKDTGLPVPNTSVSARQYSNDGSYSQFSAITAANGTYSFSGNLPVGTYHILFEPQGSPYLPQWFDTQTDFNASAVITVTNGITITGINATLSRGATITGVVSLVGGGNPSQATVTAYESQTHASVDSSGVYTLTGLQTGSYHIIFGAPGYVQQYYNGKLDLLSADAVSVTAPFTIAHINAALQSSSKISGAVTDALTSSPLNNIEVVAEGPNGAYSTYPATNGAYEIDNLPPGNYRLSFKHHVYYEPFYISKTYRKTFLDPLSSDVISLTTPGTLFVADAAMDRVGALHARIVYSDTGQSNPNQTINLSRACLPDFTYSTEPNPTFLPGVASATTYTLTAYGESLTGPSPYVPQNILFKGITSTGDLSITVLLQRGGQISGTVVNASGNALQGVQVVASSPSTSASGQAALAETGADGAFVIRALPDGTYRVRAFPTQEPSGNYASTEFPSVTISLANSVSLGKPVLAQGGQITGVITAQIGTLLAQTYTVEAVNVATGATFDTVTDSHGQYVLKGLGVGNYRVRLNAPPLKFDPQAPANPYASEFYSNTLVSSTATLVSIPSVPFTVTGINAALKPGGTIAGKVADAFGIAISGARVSIYDASNTLFEQVQSRQDGTYVTSPALPAGQYKVRVSDTVCNGVPYATVFYRSTSRSTSAKTTQQVAHTDGAGASFAEATPVSVTVGQSTPIPDMTFVTGASVVTGRVTNKGGAVEGFKLSLTNGDEVTTDMTGTYTFTGVYTGALIVAPSVGMSATIPVSRNVNAPDFTSQDFEIGTPLVLYSARGRVTRSGAGVGGYILNVNNGTQVTTDSSGDYSVTGLEAGSYTITPAPGQAPATPISRTVSVPPAVSGADFVIGSRVNLPVVERSAAQLARR